MTIDEVENLLTRMREEEAAETRARVDRAQKERESVEAEKAAADAKRKAEWWRSEKLSRLRCIVPPEVQITAYEFNSGNRRWKNHRGEMVIGAELIPVEIEGGQRVLYVQVSDFKLIIGNDRDGLSWQLSNPQLMQQLASIGHRNSHPIPEAPRP
jgi:hypothetical protein